jgi:hypothetical protein
MVTDPEPVPTQPNKPRVRVVDLTSRLGAAALGSLHPDAASGSAWLDLPIVGLPGDLLVDWHRPEPALDLATSRPTPLGLYVLVGPGATPRLPDILARLADTGAAETVFLLAPNALMERLYLRENAGRLLPSAQPLVLQLPTSDPQALWMILLEQIDSLLRRTNSFFRNHRGLDEGNPMSSNLKQSMEQAMTIDGAIAVCVVDHRSGMCLAQAGGGLNLDLAAAGNSEVVRAKLRTIEALGMRSSIEDILITLQQQYHLIRLMPTNPGLFLYLALDRQRGNLALARYKLTEIERNLKV